MSLKHLDAKNQFGRLELYRFPLAILKALSSLVPLGERSNVMNADGQAIPRNVTMTPSLSHEPFDLGNPVAILGKMAVRPCEERTTGHLATCMNARRRQALGLPASLVILILTLKWRTKRLQQ